MHWLKYLDTEKFLLFTLVLVRVSGLTMFAPIYGTKEVPAQVRALLAFALAVLITPTQWNVPAPYPQTMLSYLVVVAAEMLVGVSLGLGIMILTSGMQLAGHLVATTGGLAMAETVDPSLDISVPVFSRLMFLVTTAVFVLIGGHRMVMAGLLSTFQEMPPGMMAYPESLGTAIVTLVTQSFCLAIRASAPVVTALLLATVVLGLIGRTLPQLNVLMLGFGINALLLMGLLAVTLGAAVWAFQDQVDPAMTLIFESLHIAVPTDWFISV